MCFQKIPVAAKLNTWKQEAVLQVREGGDSEPRVIVMEVVGVQIEFGGGAKLFELGMGYVKWNPGIPTEFMWLVCGS